MFLKKGETLSLQNIHCHLKSAFNKIKQEIDDHKQAINENTNEIQANNESLNFLDVKVDKLSQKIEEFALLLHQMMHSESLKQIASAQFTLNSFASYSQLTEIEFNILSLLYNTQQNDYLTYVFIAAELEIPEQKVAEAITGLLAKRIPVLKRHVTPDIIAVYLSPEFKQQKEYAFSQNSQQYFSMLRNQASQASLQSFF